MNILHIDSSPRPKSHSRELSAAIVKKLLQVAPDASIRRRDLGADPLPHATADYADTLSSPATLAAPLKDALDLAEALIREVEAVDVIVIGTPMHNFTIPSVLKAWDRPGPARRPHNGINARREGGNASGSPVFIGVASGGVFTGERGNQPDFLTPYLTLALNSIGLKTLQFLPLQATAFIEEGQAPLASEKVIDGIDLTAVRELRDVAA